MVKKGMPCKTVPNYCFFENWSLNVQLCWLQWDGITTGEDRKSESGNATRKS